MKKTIELILKILIATLGLSVAVFILLNLKVFVINSQDLLISFVIALSLVLIIHSTFTLFWMLYAWEDPEKIEQNKSPNTFYPPQHSFTVLIPARQEGRVIRDTIKAVSRVKYPDNLMEVLVLCRFDDIETIQKVKKTIEELNKKNIRLILFNSFPINKPHALNYGLKEAKNKIIAVFDAEDEPHPEILNIINTVFIRDGVDVVQSGVQLMNYKSRWFSPLNIMEYFFWFRSGLHFFSSVGKVVPLGGNTVFIKRSYLNKINGWDKNCLTEDADIGFRLILVGAKTRVIYDEQHVTQEETPHNIAGFLKQRTRWDQGFLQVFFKGDWKKLPKLRQRLTAVYVLLSPEIQALLLLYVPFSIWFAFVQKMPLIVSLFSFVPFSLFLLQLVVFMIGFYEFAKAYKFKFQIRYLVKIFITFYPYQIMLMFASFRALFRIIFNQNAWEKTLHKNQHRQIVKVPAYMGAINDN